MGQASLATLARVVDSEGCLKAPGPLTKLAMILDFKLHLNWKSDSWQDVLFDAKCNAPVFQSYYTTQALSRGGEPSRCPGSGPGPKG